MTRTLITTSLLVLAAALFAWSQGGHVGMGVLFGGLGGAALSSACVGWQQRVAGRRSDRSLSLSVVALLIYLGVAVLGTALFRFVDAAAAGADWVSFLVTYALVVFGVMTVGAFDVARALTPRAEGSRDTLHERAEA